MFRKHEKLRKTREDKLFICVFNFTQAFYSIKEYLRKEYPQKSRLVEDFFSKVNIGFIARKDISNDLKHNPDKDLRFGLGEVNKEITREANKKIIRTQYRRSWFYSGIDSVEHCNRLFQDLKTLFETHFI